MVRHGLIGAIFQFNNLGALFPEHTLKQNRFFGGLVVGQNEEKLETEKQNVSYASSDNVIHPHWHLDAHFFQTL